MEAPKGQGPRAKGRKARWLIAGATLLILAAGIAFWALRGSGAPSDLDALGQSPKAAALQKASQGLDSIFIQARFDPEARALQVQQTLTLVNRGGVTRDSLVLRTYPNAFQKEETSPIATEEYLSLCYPQGFSSGALVMEALHIGKQSREEALLKNRRYTDDAKTVMECVLTEPWQPGEALVVEAAYTLQLPQAAYRYGVNNGFYAIGNAFLMPAPWEDGAYRTDPYYPVGDPFLSDCMNYEVVLRLPQGYGCAGSGTAHVVEAEDGAVQYTFSAPAMRDFALFISPGYQQAQAMEGDTLLLAYAADSRTAQEVLGYARKALRCFEALYGPYPYLCLSLAEVDFPFGGMEYPGMAILSSSLLKEGGQALEWVVVHEVAHQWWYAALGSDPITNAWQDEALCEYSLLAYVEANYGQEARESLRMARVESAMRVTIPKGITPGSPLSYFDTMAEYSLVVYGRGAAMLCALDLAMDGGLDDFLKAYYDEYCFKRATREDFEALLQAHTGEDYAPLIIDYLDTYLTP